MNIHISANQPKDNTDTFQRLHALIEKDYLSPLDIRDGRELIRSAVNVACHYEYALGYGQSFQTHLELLVTVRNEHLKDSVDVHKLRDECSRHLQFFEHACGS